MQGILPVKHQIIFKKIQSNISV